MRIGFLLFPNVLQMDFTGPYGVLAAGPGVTLHTIWKDTQPIRSSDGLLLTPDTNFVSCPPLDILCVPGGGGILPLLADDEVHAYLRSQEAGCRYISSVCTGALVLGAAGLLRGYKATTHWQSLDMLPLFGAEPQRQRVVLDRNRMSAAGVSAGIDMALTLAGILWGDDTAQEIQLGMEYEPQPPYAAGNQETAPASVVTAVTARTAERQAARRKAAEEAAKRLLP